MHDPKPGGRVGLIVGVAALITVIVAVLHFGEAERFAALASRAEPRWLLLGLALQAATYATDAGVWYTVLGRAGERVPFRVLYALSLVSLFTNQAIPAAGVAGSVVVVRALERRGVPGPVAVAAVLVDLVGYYAAFGVALGLAIVSLSLHHHLSDLVIGMGVAVAAVGGGIAVGIFRMTAPGRPPPALLMRWPASRRLVDVLRVADPRLLRVPTLLVRACLLRGANFALDALTLWACLRAIGDTTPPGEASAAFVIGALARTLGVLPAGLGTFEAATIGGLSLFGVPVEAGLAATLLFRGLSFWLPMAPGVWLGRRFG